MHLSPETISFIRQEIKKQINIILGGQAGDNTQFVETIENLFPGMAGIVNRPVMHPYGMSSRAPAGTISVTGKQGDHLGNRIVLGHRDANRPAQEVGETVLYNAYGQQIRIINGKILVGGTNSAENAVLGQVFKTMMSAVLGALAEHKHIGNMGYYTTVPDNASVYSSNKASPVDDEAVLSDETFVRKG